MQRQLRAAMALALLSMVSSSSAKAAGLGGSLTSMRSQYQVAHQNDFTFLRTPAQIDEFVRKARLEPVESDEVLLVHDVSFPYARPAVALFIERLSEQYYAATGERLVVTSLTRPISLQPRNSHELSVHPTGMAVDLRVPGDAKARQWLEETLLSLENTGVLDATRERYPPHYHVAVYPAKYERYVATLPEDTLTSRIVRLAASLDLAARQAVVSAPTRDSVVAAAPIVSDTRSGAPAALALAGVGGLFGVGAFLRRARRRSSKSTEPPAPEGGPSTGELP